VKGPHSGLQEEARRSALPFERYLLSGVVVAESLFGRPGHVAVMTSVRVSNGVGGNSLLSNFSAAPAGASVYFATLTKVPIPNGLIARGMGRRRPPPPLLAGPALSPPNMLVIHSVTGTRKTVVSVALVVMMATISGMIFKATWS